MILKSQMITITKGSAEHIIFCNTDMNNLLITNIDGVGIVSDEMHVHLHDTG